MTPLSSLSGESSVTQPTGKADMAKVDVSVPIGRNEAEEGHPSNDGRNAGSGRRVILPLLWLAGYFVAVLAIFKLGHYIGNTLGK